MSKDVQTGLTRWAGTGPSRESTTRKRHGPGLPRARHGKAQHENAVLGLEVAHDGTERAAWRRPLDRLPPPILAVHFRTESLAIYSRGVAEP
jgi:hypothetical protein